MMQNKSNSRVSSAMQIEVHSRDQSSQTELRGWVADLIAASFHRFNNHLGKVVVRIRDVNGPRGGVDKDITIALQVRGGANKVIRQRGPDYETAIVGGLRRAKQVLSRSRDVGARRPTRNIRSREWVVS